MSRRTLVFLSVLSLTGCATELVSSKDAAQVPAARTFNAQDFSAASDRGLVSVRRDVGYMGSGCPLRVFIDAKPAADINPSEKVDVHIPEGSHIVSVSYGGTCHAADLAEASVLIKPDSSHSFRVGLNSEGYLRINPTAF